MKLLSSVISNYICLKRILYLLAILFITVVSSIPTTAIAGLTKLVSVDSNGTQGNQDSYFSSISADGRYLVFESQANNLVVGDTNGSFDVFVHDRQTGMTERVSVNSDGIQGNYQSRLSDGQCHGSVISADGRYVVFVSNATNLIIGNLLPGYSSVIYIHDRLNKVTQPISPIDGISGSNCPSISADGHFVAFGSRTLNEWYWNIYVYDRQTSLTQIVSMNNGDSFKPAISADGRYVVFESHGRLPNIDYAFAPGVNIYVHDRNTGLTELVSVTENGRPFNSNCLNPVISADGRYVAFASYAWNYGADTTFDPDIFVFDRQSRTMEIVSVNNYGTQGNGYNIEPAISGDGRYVAYTSEANNLVSNDTNGLWDIFVHDRQTKMTERVSLHSNGSQGNGSSGLPSISRDGRYITYCSGANNLVSNDTNGVVDVFIYDRKLCLNSQDFLDTDCDGLADVVEKNTKIFVDPDNTGTDPNNPDTDGDALLDGWEVNGHNGLDLRAMGANPLHKDVFVEIDRMYNDTDDTSLTNYRPLDKAMQAVKTAYEAAPADKVKNPDGKPGINLHIDYGQSDCSWCRHGGSLIPYVNEFGWVNEKCDLKQASDTLKNDTLESQFDTSGIKYFEDNRRDVFHYAAFVHSLCNKNLGQSIGGAPSATLLIGLGKFKQTVTKAPILDQIPLQYGGTWDLQAGTFMHELGHNLGLTHSGPLYGADGKAGFQNVDDDNDGKTDESDEYAFVCANSTPHDDPTFIDNCPVIDLCNSNSFTDIWIEIPPNYLSVMNYHFAYKGLIKNGKAGFFDYSVFNEDDIPTLDEKNLNEKNGLKDGTGTPLVGGAGVFGTRYYCTENGKIEDKTVKNANSAIDWSCGEGMSTDITTNINKDNYTDCNNIKHPFFSKLRSFDDWSSLIYDGGGVIGSLTSLEYPYVNQEEPKEEDVKNQKPIPPIGLTFTVNIGSVNLRWEEDILGSTVGFYIYRKVGSGDYQRIGESLTNSFDDTQVVGGVIITYGVTTVDIYGNESDIWETVFITTHNFEGFLPPIENDGTSVFKLGSTVPVKFQLTDASGNYISSSVAKLWIQKYSNSEPSGEPVEVTSAGSANEGNTFRYDSSVNLYIYNLNTKGLSVGIWQIQAMLDDGTVRSVFIGLK